jgi:actin-like protein 6A
MFFGGDEVGALVIDVGHSSTRGGYAGEDTPKSVFPSVAGVIFSKGKDGNVGEGPMAIDDESDKPVNLNAPQDDRIIYTGDNVKLRRDNMEIVSPFENGLVSDWDIIENLWRHTYFDRLRVDPKEHPVVLSEPSYNTTEQREKMAELIFEKFEVPAMFISKSAVLTAFASGKGTALVIDSGSGMTVAAPVHEGYVLQRAIVKSPLAGDELTQAFEKMLIEKGVEFRPSYSFTKKEVRTGDYQITPKNLPNTTQSYHQYMTHDLVQDIKESVCKAYEAAYDEKILSTMATAAYELPDTKIVDIGADRFRIPEAMFNPTIIEDRFYSQPNIPKTGLAHMIHTCVSNCDSDLLIRKDSLVSNVLVTGGNTLYPNFTERLQSELNVLSPHGSNMRYKVVVAPTNVERKYSAWIGGSILASLGTFQQIWVSKQEYEEHGKSIVERKCP